MKLYRITTHGLGDFYIIAKDLNTAESVLSDSLSNAEYGFNSDQKVISIEIMAHEVSEFPAGKLNFSSGGRLLIEAN